MKRTIVALTFLLATSGVVSAQFTPTKENLRGLTGVSLTVMFARADALDQAQRPEVLKMLEADAVAKLQKAGIPVLRFAGEIQKAGGPRLILLVTLDKPNGFVHPIVTEVKLFQRVRLARDPSIEIDAVTWSLGGVGGPKLDVAVIRDLMSREVDRFIEDYLLMNPRQAATSVKNKP